MIRAPVGIRLVESADRKGRDEACHSVAAVIGKCQRAAVGGDDFAGEAKAQSTALAGGVECVASALETIENGPSLVFRTRR